MQILYKLTEKGEARLDQLDRLSVRDSTSGPQADPGYVLLRKVLTDIASMGFVSGPDGHYLDSLVRKGLVERETRSIYELLDHLEGLPISTRSRGLWNPRGLSGALRVYADLALQKFVREERLDSAVRFMRTHITADMPRSSKDYKNLVKMADSAVTRGDKITALDSLVGVLHEDLAWEGSSTAREAGRVNYAALTILEKLARG